jgi:hypothetical protein
MAILDADDLRELAHTRAGLTLYGQQDEGVRRDESPLRPFGHPSSWLIQSPPGV